MIRLCYSNRTEALLDALAEHAGAGRSSLYDPIALVIPNPLVEGYVKRGLARARGIAANIEARFLRGFLKEVAAKSAHDTVIVDRDDAEGELLALFHDPRRLGPRDLEPVRAYLDGASPISTGGGAPDSSEAADNDGDDGRDRRRVQLAARVAALFDEYAFSRPEMLAAWREGALAPGAEEALQRWQRELWLALHGRQGAFAARGATTLPDFFARTPPEALRVPPAVHVFGISYVARLYRSIFAALARATSLYVYTLNPCREFWEDLEPRRRGATSNARFPRRRGGTQLVLGGLGAAEPAAQGAGDGAADGAADENPLLAAWGRPGRDNLRLLNQLADCDFESRFVDPTAASARPTLLATLQKEILDREPPGRRPAPDDSLVVTPAADPRRELETVAAEIWSLVRADPTLRLSDFAVIVPPAAAPAYLPLLAAVFEEASALPHTIVDLPRPTESRILVAVALLLELPLGLLGRPEVLRLAMHPAVARRFPDVDPDDWVALCEELEIVRGADGDDHAGSYLERDRLSWDQGLRRLALGAFLSGPRSGERRPFVLGGAPVLAAELGPPAEPAARALGMLARELIAYARAARARPASFATHAALLRRTMASILAPTPDEEAALGDAYDVLERVGAIVPPELEMSFRVAVELVRERLASATGRGRHRSPEGVTVASFVPMRALPFRIVFVVGLDERAFPSVRGFGPLDLRADVRQPGDVPPREQDEYLFLEALLSARERLYLCHVGRDPITGDPRLPSSTVLTLLDAVGDAAAPGAANPKAAGPEATAPQAATVRRAMPALARQAEATLAAVIPAVGRERRAAALGRALRRATGSPLQLPSLAEVRSRLAPAAWSAVAPCLGWTGPPAADVAARRRALTLADLRRFLECPLQASARVWLPFGGDDEAGDEAEAALREHERLDEARAETVPFARQVLADALAEAVGGDWPDDDALGAAYDRAAPVEELDGILPSGLFGRAARARHLDLLRCWRDGLRAATEAWGPRALPRLAPVWLGAAPEYLSGADLRPAPRLALPDGTETAIGGASELLAEAGGERLAVSLIASASRDYVERDFLRPYFTHLALAALGDGERPLHAILIRPNEDGTPSLEQRVLPAISPADARDRLAALAADLFGRTHAYFLPCEAVFTWRRRLGKPNPLGLRDAVLLLRHDNWTRFVSDRGPIPDARHYPIPSEADAREIVARRFEPFFAAIEPAPGAAVGKAAAGKKPASKKDAGRGPRR